MSTKIELEQVKNDLKELKELVLQLVKPKKRKVLPKKRRSIKKIEKVEVEEVEDEPEVKPTKAIRVIKTTTNTTKKPYEKHGKQCRQEPMNLHNRINLFLKDPIKNSHKQDIAIDKKLSGNQTLTPRREEAVMLEVACIKCGNVEVVSPTVVSFDYDSQEARYVCDSCTRNK